MHSDLADYFPDYQGPKKDAEKAKDFILKMFLNVAPKGSEVEKTVYSHYTCATGWLMVG
jgi:guanine nucleotide-binding protein G(q) subunit alpha